MPHRLPLTRKPQNESMLSPLAAARWPNGCDAGSCRPRNLAKVSRRRNPRQRVPPPAEPGAVPPAAPLGFVKGSLKQPLFAAQQPQHHSLRMSIQSPGHNAEQSRHQRLPIARPANAPLQRMTIGPPEDPVGFEELAMEIM